jgi:hypothetical protein
VQAVLVYLLQLVIVAATLFTEWLLQVAVQVVQELQTQLQRLWVEQVEAVEPMLLTLLTAPQQVPFLIQVRLLLV